MHLGKPMWPLFQPNKRRLEKRSDEHVCEMQVQFPRLSKNMQIERPRNPWKRMWICQNGVWEVRMSVELKRKENDWPPRWLPLCSDGV